MTATSDSATAGGDRDDIKLALDYAWAWFSMHSAQRMQLMNYLVLSLALTTAAYGTAIGNDKYWVATAIALCGGLLSVVFERLDIRTRELVQVCESTLAGLEAELGRRAGLSELNFVMAIQKPATRFTTYRVVLRVLTRAGLALFVAGGVYALIAGVRAG